MLNEWMDGRPNEFVVGLWVLLIPHSTLPPLRRTAAVFEYMHAVKAVGLWTGFPDSCSPVQCRDVTVQLTATPFSSISPVTKVPFLLFLIFFL